MIWSIQWGMEIFMYYMASHNVLSWPSYSIYVWEKYVILQDVTFKMKWNYGCPVFVMGCFMVWYDMMWFNVKWYEAMSCSMSGVLFCEATWYDVMFFKRWDVILHNVMWWGIKWCDVVWWWVIWYDLNVIEYNVKSKIFSHQKCI